LTFWEKRTSSKRSTNGGEGGTGVYMREGNTSRVMAADRPYGEFYDFIASVRNILDYPRNFWRDLNQNSVYTCYFHIHVISVSSQRTEP
jgi:hypothetical protein